MADYIEEHPYNGNGYDDEDDDYVSPGMHTNTHNYYNGDYPHIDASDLYNADDSEDPGFRDLSNMHATQMKTRPQPLSNTMTAPEEEDEDEDLELAAKLSAYHYNPKDYASVKAPASLAALFSMITAHTPEDVQLPTKLKPFIPDYIPSVGDTDSFIKIPRPDGKPELCGLKFLDEPALSQSDPTVLELRLRRATRKAGLGEGQVRSIPEADKNPAKITAWLAEMKKATVDRGVGASVTYSKPMPNVEDLVRVWPAGFEKVLAEIGLPSADIDMDVLELSRVACALLDIPVYDNIIDFCAMFAQVAKRVSVVQFAKRSLSTAAEGANGIKVKSIAYGENGNPAEVLKLVETTIEPSKVTGATWALVKQLASPINPADINLVEGTYGVKAKLPAIGGNEGVFEVLSSGPGSNLRAGDWVVPVFPGIGTWRSHILGDSIDFLKVPQVGKVEDIATVMVNPCTAFRMLEDFVNLKPGDVVVQNGATSGVGKAVIQICKARGIKTINIVRERPDFTETRARLMDLGADVVIEDSVLRDKAAVAGILSAAGLTDKAKLGLNCVSGTATMDMARLVDSGATIVTYGGMSRKPVMMGTGSFIFSDIILRGFWMTRWSQTHEPTHPERLRMLTALFAMIQEGKLKQDHQIISVSSQEDVAKAVEAANAPHKGAKVVLKFN